MADRITQGMADRITQGMAFHKVWHFKHFPLGVHKEEKGMALFLFPRERYGIG